MENILMGVHPSLCVRTCQILDTSLHEAVQQLWVLANEKLRTYNFKLESCCRSFLRRPYAK